MGEIVHFWWRRCLCCRIRLAIVGNENRLLFWKMQLRKLEIRNSYRCDGKCVSVSRIGSIYHTTWSFTQYSIIAHKANQCSNKDCVVMSPIHSFVRFLLCFTEGVWLLTGELGGLTTTTLCGCEIFCTCIGVGSWAVFADCMRTTPPLGWVGGGCEWTMTIEDGWDNWRCTGGPGLCTFLREISKFALNNIRVW